jgi:hypothetical protein
MEERIDGGYMTNICSLYDKKVTYSGVLCRTSARRNSGLFLLGKGKDALLHRGSFSKVLAKYQQNIRFLGGIMPDIHLESLTETSPKTYLFAG